MSNSPNDPLALSDEQQRLLPNVEGDTMTANTAAAIPEGRKGDVAAKYIVLVGPAFVLLSSLSNINLDCRAGMFQFVSGLVGSSDVASESSLDFGRDIVGNRLRQRSWRFRMV